MAHDVTVEVKVVFTTSNGLSSETVLFDEFEVSPSSLQEYNDSEAYDPAISTAEGTITLYIRTTSDPSDTAAMYLDCISGTNDAILVPFRQ